MTKTTCGWCEQPIRPGEPAAQIVTLHRVAGVLIREPKSRLYHVRSGCFEASRRNTPANDGGAPE